MAVLALNIAESPADRRRAVAQRLRHVALRARERFVFALKLRPRLVVIELIRYLALFGVVAGLAVFCGLGLPELPGVHVVVTPRAVARDPAIRGGLRAFLLLAVARGAWRSRVRTEQRPRRVIDLRLMPIERGVALRATTLGHLLGELIAMRIGVTLRALLLGDDEVDPWLGARMTTAAWRRAVFAVEHELGRRVLHDSKRRRREAVDGMALRAFAVVARHELAFVLVRMTRRARGELEILEPLRDRLGRRMTARAIDRCVLAGEWITSLAVIVATDAPCFGRLIGRTVGSDIPLRRECILRSRGRPGKN